MLKCSYAHRVQTIQCGICSYVHFTKSYKNIVSIKSKGKFNHSLYFFYLLLKHVWSLSKKIKGHQAFNLFQLLLSCRASQVALPKQGRACQPKSLPHWLQLYCSFNGWRFFQPRVSARKPGQQLGYTPTIFVHSAIPTS